MKFLQRKLRQTVTILDFRYNCIPPSPLLRIHQKRKKKAQCLPVINALNQCILSTNYALPSTNHHSSICSSLWQGGQGRKLFEGSKYKGYSFMMLSKEIQKITAIYFHLLIELYKKARLLKARRRMIFVTGNST